MTASSDEGFATVAAIGVTAMLAAVAVGLLQIGFGERQRVREEQDRQERMLAVRSAIAMRLADVLGEPASVPSEVNVPVGRWTVAVRVTNEQVKANLNSADVTHLAAALVDAGTTDAEGLAAKLVALRAGSRSLAQASAEAWLDEVGVEPKEWACALQALTVYGSSLDPLASGTSPAWDGAVITISGRVIAPVTAGDGRERTFVVTGDAARPVVELADRRFRIEEREGCGHAAD